MVIESWITSFMLLYVVNSDQASFALDMSLTVLLGVPLDKVSAQDTMRMLDWILVKLLARSPIIFPLES